MDYQEYKNYLGDVPYFLKKYLDLDILKRLKGISLLCGMEYASKNMYDFKFYISRYDHSLNTALITWKLTNDKTQTLAALFHDVSSPAFSHVVDFMNGDFINQESTEEKIGEILTSSTLLKQYLIEDAIDIEDIINFKKFSIVDLPRPKMCADRLECIISVGMNWVGRLTSNDAKKIIDSMYVGINENKSLEISFDDVFVGEYVKYINDLINELTHTKEDNYMMNLLASILKLGIELKLFTYDDLFKMNDAEVVDILEEYSCVDFRLTEKWALFKSIKKVSDESEIITKNKVVNPICRGRRLISN